MLHTVLLVIFQRTALGDVFQHPGDMQAAAAIKGAGDISYCHNADAGNVHQPGHPGAHFAQTQHGGSGKVHRFFQTLENLSGHKGQALSRSFFHPWEPPRSKGLPVTIPWTA